MSAPARLLLMVLLAFVAVTGAGCAAVAGIFKAGFWVGIIIAAVIIIILFALFGRRG